MKGIRISFLLGALLLIIVPSGQAQMMDEFSKMTWTQKDSVISMFFAAGATSLSYPMIEDAYTTEKSATTPRPAAMARFADWQGLRYLNDGDYPASVAYFQESLDWHEKDPNATMPQVRSTTINLADAMENAGDTSSMSTFDQALAMMEANNTGEDRLYLDLLIRSAQNRLAFDRFPEAEELAKESLRIAKSVYTQRSNEYLTAFTTLGKVYEASGAYRKGGNLIMQAFELSKGFLEADDPHRLDYYYEAIDLQKRLGRKRNIAPIYREGLVLFNENEQLKEGSSYPTFLDRMGGHYLSIDSLEQAAEYIEEANVLFSLRAEKTSPQYVISQIHMGDMLRRQERYLEAETYLSDALKYVGNAYGQNSTVQADLHAALSDLYTALGNDRKALQNQMIAAEIYRRSYGETDERYLNQLADLGVTFKDIDADTSIQILNTAYESYLGKFDLGHPYVYQSARDLSNVYLSMGNNAKAIEYAQLAVTSLNRQLDFTYPLLSEEERKSSDVELFPFIGELIELLPIAQDPKFVFDVHTIFAKLEQLQNSVHPATIARITASPDDELIERFRSWQDLSDDLYESYNSSRDLQNESTQTIDDLKKNTSSYALALRATDAVKGVTKGAGTDGTYIELFDASRYLEGTVQWIAFLYGGQGNQSQVVIFNEAEMDCQQFWDQLSPSLQPGKLHFINHGASINCAFETLQNEKGKYLDEDFQIQYLRAVERPTNFKLIGGEALLAGGFDYDDNVTPAGELSMGLNAIVPDSLLSNINFRTLNGSKAELNKMSSTLRKKDWVANWIGSENIPGNKEAFLKYAADGPDLIHLSTFRYFFDPNYAHHPKVDSLQTFANTTTDKMLRASLIFDEANAIVRRPKTGSSLPGYLTALEIARLDLSNTKLVILSGHSESISGEVPTNVGMLVDAFRAAGTKMVLYSRDNISAESKAIFLKEFTKNLTRGLTVGESWSRTKSKLRKKYDPSVWAAFLLVG